MRFSKFPGLFHTDCQNLFFEDYLIIAIKELPAACLALTSIKSLQGRLSLEYLHNLSSVLNLLGFR